MRRLTKREVRSFMENGGKTAEFIIAHARRQESLGRNPSEGWGTILNPEKALEAAYRELTNYHALVGEHIDHTVKAMVEISNFTGRSCTSNFNGIKIVATPGVTTSDAIVSKYKDAVMYQKKRYAESSEGKALAKKVLEQQRTLRLQANQMMAELPELNLLNPSDVIAWIGEIRAPINYTGVKVPIEKIISTLEEAGYVADVNCDDEYDEKDKENVARYLIGQALSCLKEQEIIPQILMDFEKRWCKKFAV